MSKNMNEHIPFSCPFIAPAGKTVTMADGSGGSETWQLLADIFFPGLSSDTPHDSHDGALVSIENNLIAFTTDSFVVQPLFFPGGDIGSLAVFGTVNDLAMCGATPAALSAGFIIEENFPRTDLRRIVESMGQAAARAGTRIVTGDTKVVEKGKCDGIYISTAGIGIVRSRTKIHPGAVRADDVILLSGDLGRHATAVLAAREELAFETDIQSDCDCLLDPVMALLSEGIEIHCLRDLTRGGLSGALNEISRAAGALIRIRESDIPVCEAVKGACEILGFDPLQLANEGRFICILPRDHVRNALSILGQFDVTKESRVIGGIPPGPGSRVELETLVKTTRILDMPSGLLLPRIC
jgi:hydrogenase expression/formation protein HypE